MNARVPPAQPSLQRTLLGWLLVPLLGLIPLAAGLIYLLALRPALDGLDRALTDTAVALAQVLEQHDGQVTLPLSEQTARALRADAMDRVEFAVGDPQGRLLGGDAQLLALAPPLAAGEWRFFEAPLHGRPVRVAAQAVPCASAPGAAPCAILVAETLGKRTAAARAALLAALLGAASLALPMAGLALLAVRYGMRPLRTAAAEVGALTPDRLDPVDPHQVPREAQSFVIALNDLFRRLREAAAAQRAFIADAAHQLRTPLSVLRVESAQALAQPHPPALQPVLARLHAAAERGARLAQQLLALAQAEGALLDRAAPARRLDLARLAADAADRWLQPSLQAGQDLGFELQPAWVAGDAVLLAELLGNLLHNAIEHAGRGARITVRTRMQGGCAELAVEDDGPGVAADEHARLWQRFQRGRAAACTGSGLGLAIVRDIARLHGAEATLTPGAAGRGLCASVRFPAAPRDGQAPGAGETEART